MLDGLELWAEGLAASPWIFVVLFAFVTIDAIFPPVPSESFVIALAALSVSSGSPNLWILAAVAAAGAFTGDVIAYSVGTRLDVRGMRLMRGRRVQAAFVWAQHALEHRPAPIIIAARYIPVGRVAVNVTAGTLQYSRKKFTGLAGVAAVSWAGYSTLIGVGAGAWLEHTPVLAVAVGVVGGILIGFVVDWVLGRLLRARTARTARLAARGALDRAPDGTGPAGAPVVATAPGAHSAG